MEAIATAIPNRSRAYPRRWLAAVVMIGAATMDLIDLTIVNVALPTIRDRPRGERHPARVGHLGLHARLRGGPDRLGSFGDLLGRKRIFVAGIATFGIASLAAGLAQNPDS